MQIERTTEMASDDILLKAALEQAIQKQKKNIINTEFMIVV